MDAAALVQLAAARGIDLAHVAGAASSVDGAARPRSLSLAEIKRRKLEHLGLEVQPTATGRGSRSTTRAAWSVADLGMAAQGLGAIPWAAALYSFAGSREGYWLLWHALASEANRYARREYWPPRILDEHSRRIFYREELAELVLIEDANRHLFTAAPPLYAICMGVTGATWERQLHGPFCSLRGSYDRWLSVARASIRNWICNQPTARVVDNA